MSYSCLSKFACVSNRSEGNPAWAWRRRSMDRPKLAICAVEKAPPSFPPAFCRTLIGLPPIISLRERAGGRRASEPHLTICHCQPVGRLARRTDASARFASLRNTFQLQRQLRSRVTERTQIRAPKTFCGDSSPSAHEVRGQSGRA